MIVKFKREGVILRKIFKFRHPMIVYKNNGFYFKRKPSFYKVDKGCVGRCRACRGDYRTRDWLLCIHT